LVDAVCYNSNSYP